MAREVTVDGITFQAGAKDKKAFYIKNQKEVEITLPNAKYLQWLAGDIENLNQTSL
jgi:hypothetical protein